MDGRRHHGFVDGRGRLAALVAAPTPVAGQASGVGSTGPPTTPQRLSAAAAAALPPAHSLDDDNEYEISMEQQKREPEGHLPVEIRHATETSAVPSPSLPCNDSLGSGALGPTKADIRLPVLRQERTELDALHPTDPKPTAADWNRPNKGHHEALRGDRLDVTGGIKNRWAVKARSPNLNSYAERFVLSIKSECLHRIVPLGEAHLRRAIGEFVTHYHGERHHQGRGGELISPGETAGRTEGPITCRERLGGMLKYYHREAA